MSKSCPNSGNESSLPLRFVESSHAEPRKKKSHKKSRGGCVACKRRKVKCDERIPCTNCVRRNETCQSSQSSSPPSNEPSPAPQRPSNPSEPVNLLHLELFNHFQQTTVPTLCFAEVWDSAISLAFKEEYLMTAMLATSARHLSILQPENPVYSEAAMSLLPRSCASFGAVLAREDGAQKHNSLFFTAMLIHYITWCNLDFVEGQHDGGRLDLRGDQLFLLSSGVRVFLSRTRERGSESIMANMSPISQCSALEKSVEDQHMDCNSIIDAFMEQYDKTTDKEGQQNPPTARRMPSTIQAGVTAKASLEREADRGISTRLSVILALWKHKDSNPSPPHKSNLERYIFSFPLFCFGTFLDMITHGDSRAMLVLYHFYRASISLLGDEIPWWAAGRLDAMEKLLRTDLERRDIDILSAIP